jgi:radical SAM superfamily enzyme YgiQ (UPF0313 family)
VRVLLVSVNRVRDPFPVHPIGLDHVAGALAPVHDVRILDLCPLEEGALAPALAAAVREHAPGAVGLSLRNVDLLDVPGAPSQVALARRVAGALREVTGAPLVLGGAGFTLFPGEILAALDADWGVVGEGERARALFDALAAGADPRGLPGVIGRGEPAVRPPPLPGAGRRLLPEKGPALDFYLSRGGMLGLQTQRGCRLRCVYCAYPQIEGRAVRPFEVEEVLQEALGLEALGARYLVLTDSVFNGVTEHALAVADAFRRGGLGIPWGGFFAPLDPPPGFYDAMRAGGCAHVEFGTESLSAAVLGRLQKPFRPADVHRAHTAARAAGIHVAHFLLPGGPGETADTLTETLDACEALEGAPLFFFCGVRIYPGTDLWAQAVEAGQLRRDQRLLDPVYWECPGLPPEAIREAVQRRGRGRRSWRTGGEQTGEAPLLARMHARGRVGPLWELLA